MRLGLDIGTNSIGWWLYETDGPEANARITGVITGGVRIFSDGRDSNSGTSRAAERRKARSMRRRRDRYLRRRATLMRVMAEAGLMPSSPEEAKKLEGEDPYELRERGLYDMLQLTHFGRALFHINQRRGFKSNRKTDRGNNESGKIKDATARLEIAMMATQGRNGDSVKTYGEFLHIRRKQAKDFRFIPSVRTRMSIVAKDDKGKDLSGYEFYPSRHHLENEFHELWRKQAQFHPTVLTDKLRDTVFEKIFFQRQLKAPKIGLCTLTGEERLPNTHPLTQRRVLYETVNHLRIETDGKGIRRLELNERDAIVSMLDNKKHTNDIESMKIALASLTKKLKLPNGARFTLQSTNRKFIKCDPIHACMSNPIRLGLLWASLNFEEQWQLLYNIKEIQSEKEFNELVELIMNTHNISETRAKETVNAPLPNGYSRLGLTATKNILAQLEKDVVTYSEAVESCGMHHSNLRTGEVLDTLPYYGKVLERHVIPGSGDLDDDEISCYGRIANPTVHIGLNQLRRIVNRIIQVYGKPSQIVVELARDVKHSMKQKILINKGILENTNSAKKRSQKLLELKQIDNGYNRMLLRLWEDLGPAIGPRCCPYTGESICASMLFDGSCEVDHILPYSRTLDNSVSNKTLCISAANREKRNKSPWEAWGSTPRWEVIEANLSNLPENKRWRFNPDAMSRYEGERNFLDRALVDTQYLSRIARTYLDKLYAEGGHVWVVPGRMTEMLRRAWGLNVLLADNSKNVHKVKNRCDLRHHAVDAAVVGATDPHLINNISKAAGLGEESNISSEKLARCADLPWRGFRTDVQLCLENIIVVQRPERGKLYSSHSDTKSCSTSDQLHNETAYGIINNEAVVSRVPFESLTRKDIVLSTRGKNIRDPLLRKLLIAATDGKEGTDFIKALAHFSTLPGPYCGIRRIRLIETVLEKSRVEIRDRSGRIYKAYKGDSNFCYELWRLPHGKVVPQVVSTFQAHTGKLYRPHPAAKRVLRIFKKDMVSMERDGKTEVYYVQKLDKSHGLYLVPHYEGNADARARVKDFKFIVVGVKNIIANKLRRLYVDEIGNIR